MVVPQQNTLFINRELPRVPLIIQADEKPKSQDVLQTPPMGTDLRLPFQYIVREHAKSIIAIQELQHEVSSLLVLKDALLETFPHLHHRLHGQDGRRLGKEVGGGGGSGGGGGGEMSDEHPVSWSTGSIPRMRRIRKSPEGSSTGSTVADSGFSTEKGQDSVSTQGGKYSPPEVRWDTWTMSRHAPSPPSPPLGGEDELMSLLDVIHRKAVKLRSQSNQDEDRRLQDQRKISDKSRNPGPGSNLGAISESSELYDPYKDRRRSELNGSDRDHLVDRITELENETIRSRNCVLRLENEMVKVSRQKEMLEEQLRLSEGSKDKEGSSASGSTRAQSEGPGGIIHSVQILTGESRRANSPESARMLSQSETNLRMAGRGSVNIEIRQPGDSLSGEPGSRVHRPGRLGLPPSVSVVNLRTSSENLYGTYGPVHQGGSVDALNRYPPSGQLVNQYPPSGQLVNLHHTNQIHSDHSKYFQTKLTGPPVSGKDPTHASQLRRVLSNDKLAQKSRSVDNLFEARLRKATSEISLQPRAGYNEHNARLKGTSSEQVLTRLGKQEKVKLSGSVVSVPGELGRHGRLVVRPNRERIRQILGTGSVLELQRQLLTAVMENEVYKTQLTKISEAWDGKINDFEKVNSSLQSNLSKLRAENERLRLQVEERSKELEGTRSRLSQLESTSEPQKSQPPPSQPVKPDPVPSRSGLINKSELSKMRSTLKPAPVERSEPIRINFTDKPEQTNRRLSQPELDLSGRITSENYVKYPISDLRSPVDPKVTFDLGPKKAKLNELLPPVKRTIPLDRPASQLPTDARQRLQELAGHDIKRNYRKNSEPIRPSKLNISNGVSEKYIVAPSGQSATKSPTQPQRTYNQIPAAHSPLGTQFPVTGTGNVGETGPLKRTSLTRKDSRKDSQLNSAKNSLIMNFQNNNVKKSGRDTPVTRGSTGNRTRTPSVERSITSKDDPSKEISTLPSTVKIGSSGGRLLPAPPLLDGKTLPPNMYDGKTLPPTLTSIDIKQLEHETIADLIAGILQKCSKRDEHKRSTAGLRHHTTDESESESSRPQTAVQVTELTGRVSNPTGSTTTISTPNKGTSLSRGVSNSHPKSWETYNHTEEELHISHTTLSQSNNSTAQTNDSTPRSNTNYLEYVQGSRPIYSSQDSLTLPDSLNDFEGEDYQSPTIYPDSLSSRNKFNRLGVPDDIDSLQLEELGKSANSPDSLNAGKNSPTGEFFDSITLEEKKVGEIKRRIIPFGENSLSSGNSVFTSQDASLDSKESSPPVDNIKQGNPIDLYTIHPLRESPADLRFHPLTNRFSTCPDLSVKDDQEFADSEPTSHQTKDMMTSPALMAAPHNSNLRNGISIAKQATEKLKWKFLGW